MSTPLTEAVLGDTDWNGSDTVHFKYSTARPGDIEDASNAENQLEPAKLDDIKESDLESVNYPKVDKKCEVDDPGFIWMNDKDVTKCVKCDIKFTFVQRKHHCRSCGSIFCATCCPKRKKYIGTRFCIDCFTKIETPQASKNASKEAELQKKEEEITKLQGTVKRLNEKIYNLEDKNSKLTAELKISNNSVVEIRERLARQIMSQQPRKQKRGNSKASKPSVSAKINSDENRTVKVNLVGFGDLDMNEDDEE